MPGAAGTHCSHGVGDRVSHRDATGTSPPRAGRVVARGPVPIGPGAAAPYGRGMAQLGADDVEVDRLATSFDTTAVRLRSSEESITTSVTSVTWLGPDADVFRSTWK